jgi:UDP-glucuronate 4-epimerase
MKYLVTGAAGFIGFHVSQRLLAEGHTVFGYDNLNDYYEVSLKEARLAELKNIGKFTFEKGCVSDSNKLEKLFVEHKFNQVIHLAAQAGVRYSIDNPMAYIESNIVGHAVILECCRHNKIEHLVYASSSSVYGLNEKQPFSTADNVDHPVSLYAATKKSNELMSHTYSHLYGLPTTGLRFFTVYGSWGRPDMALFKFTKAILAGETIDVYNFGEMKRDFTYIDDIVDGILKSANTVPLKNPAWSGNTDSSSAPYKVYNLGNSKPVKLMDFIHAIENASEIKAKVNLMPIQPGDVESTWADTTKAKNELSYEPKFDLNKGVGNFVDWYRSYYIV